MRELTLNELTVVSGGYASYQLDTDALRALYDSLERQQDFETWAAHYSDEGP